MKPQTSLEQMGLFEMSGGQPSASPAPSTPPKKERKPATRKTVQKPTRTKGARRGSGLVPEGDVRLTANIREDLHLRLKLAAARQRTTIGELIEGLVERYI